MKVTVYGSAPGARIVPGADCVYFANFSALGWDRAQVEKSGDVLVNVISGGLTHRDNPHPDEYAKAQELRRIRWTKRVRVYYKSSVERATVDKIDGAPHEDVFREEWDTMLYRVSGVKTPIIDASHFCRGFLLHRGKFRRKAHNLIRYAADSLRRQPTGLNAYFLPSTGLWALIYAIAENGQEAKYTLRGFSWNERSTHNVFNRKIEPKHFAPHIQADKLLLRRLSRRYAIETSPEE